MAEAGEINAFCVSGNTGGLSHSLLGIPESFSASSGPGITIRIRTLSQTKLRRPNVDAVPHFQKPAGTRTRKVQRDPRLLEHRVAGTATACRLFVFGWCCVHHSMHWLPRQCKAT